METTTRAGSRGANSKHTHLEQARERLARCRLRQSLATTPTAGSEGANTEGSQYATTQPEQSMETTTRAGSRGANSKHAHSEQLKEILARFRDARLRQSLVTTPTAGSEGEKTEGAKTEGANLGKMNYGCKHYRRRCKIRAPCCNQIFTCRYCHNEAMESLSNPMEYHELIRQDIQAVICAICDFEQPIAKTCCNCGVNMGAYFCEVCKVYDDNESKDQFHCDDCGVCRSGGRENTFHCPKCGCCMSRYLQGTHTCVENLLKQNCSICLEDLFDTWGPVKPLDCGHYLHLRCSQALYGRLHYPKDVSFEGLISLKEPN